MFMTQATATPTLNGHCDGRRQSFCFPFFVFSRFFRRFQVARNSLDPHSAGAFIGTPIFDDSFDLTTSEAQICWVFA